ncbi:MAG: hypothetical protein AAGF95_25810 [Chloroflexota bacterium]
MTPFQRRRLDQVRQTLRRKHDTMRTEEATVTLTLIRDQIV